MALGPGSFPLVRQLSVAPDWSSFAIDWGALLALAVLAAAYERGARTERSGEGVVDVRRRRPSFYGALLVIAVALNGWLRTLSDHYLFSVHMVQHLLLILVAAPLLLHGLTPSMLRRVLRHRRTAPVGRWLTKPAHCFAIFNVTLAAWHLPPLFNAAMASPALHALQHATLVAAAVLVWWPLLSPLPELPRLSYPGQMLYCFLMSIPTSLVAVYIAYADALLYRAYASVPRLGGLAPLEDQLIGGLVMWIPSGFFFFGVMSFVFWRWQAHDGDDTVAAAQVPDVTGVPR